MRAPEQPRSRTLTPATAHPEFAKASTKIVTLPAIKGEVWAPGSVTKRWVSSCSRVVFPGHEFKSQHLQGEMLRAFDRAPDKGERSVSVAEGDDVRTFGWRDDVELARALNVIVRALEIGSIKYACKREGTAHRLLRFAESYAPRLESERAGSPLKRLRRIEPIIRAEVAKIRQRRVFWAGLAATWPEILRGAGSFSCVKIKA